MVRDDSPDGLKNHVYFGVDDFPINRSRGKSDLLGSPPAQPVRAQLPPLLDDATFPDPKCGQEITVQR